MMEKTKPGIGLAEKVWKSYKKFTFTLLHYAVQIYFYLNNLLLKSLNYKKYFDSTDYHLSSRKQHSCESQQGFSPLLEVN